MKRSFPIVLACILLPISNVFVIVFGGFLAIMDNTTAEVQLAILGTVIVWGALTIAASYGLWKLRKWGAYLAVVLSLGAIGILIGLFSLSNMFVIGAILCLGLIIILVAAGWKTISVKSLG